jgi:hypothetical protein
MSSSPQTQVTLGGYAFPTNPYTINWERPISATYNPTWTGGYINVFGQFTQDQTVDFAWPVLNYAQYQELETLKAALSPITYVSPAGVSSTVFIMEVTNGSILPGGLYAYLDVKVRIQFISTP